MATEETVFNQPGHPPNDSDLREALGPVHSAYKKLAKHYSGIPQEWKFYGAKYGWQLKVTLKGKALLYIVPRKRSFTAACAVRENEKDVLLRSKLPPAVKKNLISAKKSMEGYPVRMQVSNREDSGAVILIVETLKAARV